MLDFTVGVCPLFEVVVDGMDGVTPQRDHELRLPPLHPLDLTTETAQLATMLPLSALRHFAPGSF